MFTLLTSTVATETSAGEHWSTVGGIICSALLLLGTIYTAKRGKEANTEGPVQIASGYSQLTQDLRTDIDQLRADRERDLVRMDDLERKVESAMKRYRAALSYIRHLLGVIQLNLPGYAAPLPPEELMGDLD